MGGPRRTTPRTRRRWPGPRRSATAATTWKTDLYRAEVGQRPVTRFNDAADSPASHWQNTVNIQATFLNANQALLATGASPVPAAGSNLFTFLANRGRTGMPVPWHRLGRWHHRLMDPSGM